MNSGGYSVLQYINEIKYFLETLHVLRCKQTEFYHEQILTTFWEEIQDLENGMYDDGVPIEGE